MFDEKIKVKIRSCQVIKLILTGFVVLQELIKPEVLMHRPRKLGLSVLLRPRALYFPVQHKTGQYVHIIALSFKGITDTSGNFP